MSILDTGGDGDSIIEPGESGRIEIRIKNVSIDDVFNVRLNVISDNPALILENTSFLIDYIPALQKTEEHEVGFDFRASSGSDLWEKVGIKINMKTCNRNEVMIRGQCHPRKKFVSLGIHDKGEMFVHPVGNKFIAFYLSFGKKPKVEGLTIPISKKDLKFHFDIDI